MTTKTVGKTRLSDGKTYRCGQLSCRRRCDPGQRERKNRWFKTDELEILAGLGGRSLLRSQMACRSQTVVKTVSSSSPGSVRPRAIEMQKGIDLMPKRHEDFPAVFTIEVVKRDDGTSPDVGKERRPGMHHARQVNILLWCQGARPSPRRSHR